MTDHQMDPDDAEILQSEDVPLTAVPVVIQGPVRVQQLPRKSPGARTLVVTSAPQLIFPADPHRASCVLLSAGAFVVGFSPTGFGDGDQQPAAVLWQAGIPFRTEAVTEIWVISAEADDNGAILPVTIGCYRENWSQ